MSEFIDIIVSVTLLLLSIMNIINMRKIENLEKWVDVLIHHDKMQK